MAYIVGELTVQQEAELTERGYDVGDTPPELIPSIALRSGKGSRYLSVHVDAAAFDLIADVEYAQETKRELLASGTVPAPAIPTGRPAGCNHEFAIDELRHMVRNFGECREDFNQRFTLEQLVQLHRMWMLCGWDFYPDQWEARQVAEALAGKPPQWDPKTEKPVYG